MACMLQIPEMQTMNESVIRLEEPHPLGGMSEIHRLDYHQISLWYQVLHT